MRLLEKDREARFADSREAYDALYHLLHPPVWRTVALVAVPLVLATLGVRQVFAAPPPWLVTFDVSLPGPPDPLGTQNPLVLGAERSSADVHIIEYDTDYEDLSWRLHLLDVDGGSQPLPGWTVARVGDTNVLRISAPGDLRERRRWDAVTIEAELEGEDGVGSAPFQLVWLPAGEGVEAIAVLDTAGDLVVLTDAPRSVDVEGQELTVRVADLLDQDIASIEVVANGAAGEARLQPGRPWLAELGPLIDAPGETAVEVRVVDAAGQERRAIATLDAIVDPLSVTEPRVEALSRQGEVWWLHGSAIAVVEANRPCDLTWHYELGSETVPGGSSSLAARHRIDIGAAIPALAESFGRDGFERARLRVNATDSSHVLYRKPERGVAATSAWISYTPDPPEVLAGIGPELRSPGYVQLYGDPAALLHTSVRIKGGARAELSARFLDESGAERWPAVTRSDVELFAMRGEPAPIPLPFTVQGRYVVELTVRSVLEDGQPGPAATSSFDLVLDLTTPGLETAGWRSRVLSVADLADWSLRVDDEHGVDLAWSLIPSGAERPVAEGVARWSPGDGPKVLPLGDVQPPDGSHELVVRATDDAGNEARLSHAVVVALLPPEIDVLAPAARTWDRNENDRFALRLLLEDPNGVNRADGTLTCEARGLSLAVDGLLRLQELDDPTRAELTAEFDLDYRWSLADVVLTLRAVDGEGVATSEPLVVERTLANIDRAWLGAIEPVHAATGRSLGRMLHVPVTSGTDYVFGGRGDEQEDRERVGLGLSRLFTATPGEQSYSLVFGETEIGDYYLDEREVRVADFLLFLEDADGYSAQTFWPSGGSGPDPAERDPLLAALSSADPDAPVTGVTWDEAFAYARWAGKELPSLVQWEFALRGGRAYRLFPSGESPRTGGSDRGLFGHMELGGGVREWTSVPYLSGASLPYSGAAAAWYLEPRVFGAEAEQKALYFAAGAPPPAGEGHFFAYGRLARSQRRSDVGFRCVLPGSELDSRLASGNGRVTWNPVSYRREDP
jgi:hypothetical protein